MMNTSKNNTSNFQIVILDDNAATRNLAKATVEQHLSCVAHTCSSAEELLAISKQVQPDLYLLDVDAGDQSGIEICQQLKTLPKLANIPIVFLSAYKDPAKRVAALKAGGVDYLDKPFYPEELVTRLRTHIEMHRLRVENLEQISAQQTLLRVLCHDLVNPIFAAHALLQLKQDMGKPVDESTAKRVVNCCQSALDIILHVKDGHSLVSTDKQVKPESVSVKDAFIECVRILNGKFQKKGVELSVKVDPNANVSVNRVVLVHSILNNLLTNALKFSYPKSKVILKATVAEDNGQQYCDILVQDNGIGMPSNILASVFEENAKVSRKGTDSEQGTGFGMPIVKKYVEQNGGVLNIASIEAKEGTDSSKAGTTICIRFPNTE